MLGALQRRARETCLFLATRATTDAGPKRPIRWEAYFNDGNLVELEPWRS